MGGSSHGGDPSDGGSKFSSLHRLVSGVVLLIAVVYSCIGVAYLSRDYDVVHGCHASSSSVHVVWETNVWTYVLISIFFALACGVIAVTLPSPRVVEVFKRQFEIRARRRSMPQPLIVSMEDEFEKLQRRKARFGIMDDLPDWIFLMQGLVALSVSTAAALLAFFGYYELYVAKPWCEDRHTAFEQLDLWYFGRFTLYCQVISAVLLLILGLSLWAMPFMFELADPSEHAPLLPEEAPPQRRPQLT